MAKEFHYVLISVWYGASIFEVGTENKPVKNDLRPESETPRKPLNLKIPI